MKMLVEKLATIGNESEWLNAYETLKDKMVLGESNAFKLHNRLGIWVGDNFGIMFNLFMAKAD